MSRNYRGDEEREDCSWQREWHRQRRCGGRWHDEYEELKKPERLGARGVSKPGGSAWGVEALLRNSSWVLSP